MKLYLENFLEMLYIIKCVIKILKLAKEYTMKKYVCVVCGYIYDPEEGDPDNGVNPGTAFEDIPDEWVCPLCSVGKDEFEECE